LPEDLFRTQIYEEIPGQPISKPLQGCVADMVAPQTGVKTPAYYRRAPAGRDIPRGMDAVDETN